MSRVPRFARVAAACALALSALAVGMAPADAVTSSPTAVATGSFGVVTEGTITVTYSDFTSALVLLYPELESCPDPAGSTITPEPLYAIGGLNPLGASPVTISQGTLAGSGTPIPGGAYQFCLFDVVSAGSAYLVNSSGGAIYIPITSSFVTNSDGTITLTYANANPDVGQLGYLFLLTGVTECPEFVNPSTNTGFGFQFGAPDAVASDTPSGTVIGVGTLGLKLPITGPADIEPKPVTEGTYQVCLYQTDSTESVTLRQSGTASVGAVPVVPPVEPAFTG